MKWLLLALAVLIFLNFRHILYFNIYTHSLPYGIYMRVKGSPQRDDFAATCLTSPIAEYGMNRGYLASGNCDTGTVAVLKKIKGLPGDRFVVKNNFLELNGHSYPIMGRDSNGRALKVFYNSSENVLNTGKYFLLSDFVKNSWDSRYWGPVSIAFLLKPLWVFEPYKTYDR